MSIIQNPVFTLPDRMLSPWRPMQTYKLQSGQKQQYSILPSVNNMLDFNNALSSYTDLQKRRQKLPEDVVLKYTGIDKIFHHIKTVFIALPKTILRGLKGSKDFTFSDMMLVSKFPYYLGGAFLALSSFMGGDKKQGIRLAVAAGLYLLGTTLMHCCINILYRMRYGVDLTQMYRSKTGQVEYLFASSDFPRFDLLTHRQYTKMADKMGIPDNAPDRDGAVRDNLRYIISSSRTLKLIVANLISAIGAGYIARSDAWLSVPKTFPVVKKIWNSSSAGVLQKLQDSFIGLAESFRKPLLERLGMTGVPVWQKITVWGGIGAIIGSTLYILFKGLPERQYHRGDQQL